MAKKKPFLVAMSGGSGSGKSTLAEALLDHLQDGQAVLFGEDAYYYPMSHYGEPASKEEWTALVGGINYDAPRSKEADRLVKDLRALKAGETIHTENSHKFTARSADKQLLAGGWTPIDRWLDEGRCRTGVRVARAHRLFQIIRQSFVQRHHIVPF